MRIITSLAIASVVGSAAIGTLTRSMTATSTEDAKQTLKALFEKDRPAALRLLEQTASSCVPELRQLKSNNARKLFPRILLIRLDTLGRSGDELTSEEKKRIDKEVRQLVLAVPESESDILTAAIDRIEKEKTRVQDCISKALGEIVVNEKQNHTQKKPPQPNTGVGDS